MQFLKYVLATLTGLLLFTILGFFLLVGISAKIASSFSKTTEATVADGSVLKLDLNRSIEEVSAENPFEKLPIAGFNAPSQLGLVQLKEALANAKRDDHIKGIYLEANVPLAGYATVEEIRNALLDFKASKKFIVAYGEVYSEKGYYLSSVADKIYLNPAGGMEFNGLSTEYTFIKGTLDKLGVQPEVFKVGDYKSAVEPFLRENMSDPSRQQSQSFLTSINDFHFANVAKARGLAVTELKRIADSLLIQTPADARRYQLVTHLGYFDEVESDLRKTLKLKEDQKVPYVSLGKYQNAAKLVDEGNGDNRVAVIVASGTIVSGDGGSDNIGSDKIAAEIRKARRDPKVKAIVLRVNSGGGSALASDVMWREVELTKRAKKPIIASMSDVAASGGYYMLMNCDKIVASPNTITGSIGVFAVLFNAQGFLKDKLGVTTDAVETNEHADFPSVTHPITDFEKGLLQKSVESIYDTFTKKAAVGRGMTQDQLKTLASGRVWSGAEAKQNGLVDVLGGLEDAIALAAGAAKLKPGDYRVRYYPREKNVWQDFFSKAGDDTEARLLRNQLGNFAPYVQQLRRLQDLRGIQARLPFALELK